MINIFKKCFGVGFEAFDFTGANTVVIKIAIGSMISTYVIDKEFLRIKCTGSDFLLKVRDQNTLIGEGFVHRLYRKK